MQLCFIFVFCNINSIISRKDARTDSILAGIVNEFMTDSQLQLIIDLDLFHSLFTGESERFETNVKSSNESYLQQLLGYVEELQVFNFSKFLTIFDAFDQH